ncbi:MAG: DUF3606 domain-containing protein [Bacteroidota bacterium]|nr:DUF3606 domain-containing protein [Bacteroidota bacterium]
MQTNSYLKDGRIDTSKEGISYWSKKLNCLEKDLQEAVCKIGNTYSVLILYLEMNQKIKM